MTTFNRIHQPTAMPHVVKWSRLRASGLVITAFSLSSATDNAMLGAATTAEQARLSIAVVLAGLGGAIAAAGHLQLRDRRTTNANRAALRMTNSMLIFGTMLFVVARALPQVLDLIDDVQADRDEPTTTLVHVLRIVITAALAGALLWVSRHESRRLDNTRSRSSSFTT